ncbi:MAG: hypothetical protein A2984_01295 [Omnitrophica WOR_2 bacterium RIFCSPLOWO2_01_FULL_41_12]|nr:MAG: hypothetical protein A2984_01295 [Omnitrophica WOR_2 bacterium RIFCSPLOWO2_01_FULL_41_12]
MLKELRKKKNAKKVWIILSIIIVPAFILWGSGSLIRSKEEATFAGKIAGRKISFLEFRDAVDATRNQAIMQFGDNLPEIQKYVNLEAQAWERLILLNEAKRRKITASNREVIEQIEDYPFFKTSKGQFDNRLYSQMLQYTFHTQPRIFEEQTRQNLMLAKLYKEVTNSASLTEQEIQDEYQKGNEEISIYYISSAISDFAKDIAPKEEELKDYFTRNSIQFKQPLSFNVEYLAAESEEKIRDFARGTKDTNLSWKETGWFSQTEAIPGIGWSPQISNIISKLETGKYSAIIQLDKNYYIFRLKERKEPHIPEFENIKDKAGQAFIKDKSKAIAKAKIEDCLKGLKELSQKNPKAVDFDKTAKEFGLKSGATGLFKFGSYIEGIGASDSFWLKARGLKEGEFSQIMEEPAGFFIIKLKEKTQFDEKKFLNEKLQFMQKLLDQKKQEYFVKFIEGLKRKAQLLF